MLVIPSEISSVLTYTFAKFGIHGILVKQVLVCLFLLVVNLS